MLTVSYIRDNFEDVNSRLAKRGADFSTQLKEIIAVDEQRRSTQAKLDDLLAAMNKISREIGMLFKEGKTEEANKAKEKTGEIKEEVAALKTTLNELETQQQELLYHVPNVPNEIVPEGTTDADNEVLYTHELDVALPQKAIPHWELADKYDLIDFELGVKITGAGFPVYKNQGARLQRALINFFLDEATKEGYREVIPPLVVNEDSGYGTGQLPDKEGQMYHVQEDDLYLIPTAEVPITNIYRNVMLKQEQFPQKKVGYTPCFRREAGSYGKDVRGLNRLHQFDKVEIVQIQHPDKSYDTLQEMVNYVEGLLKKLELPYRILRLCGGDLGFTSALTYDMEVYSAAQNKWLEVSSISNFESYQANRLKVRFKDDDGKSRLAHTLNGSALALPRIVAALLENNQTENGIKIPEVLVKYTGFNIIK